MVGKEKRKLNKEKKRKEKKVKLPAKGVSLIIHKLWARQFIKQGTVGTEQQQQQKSKKIAQREDGSLVSYSFHIIFHLKMIMNDVLLNIYFHNKITKKILNIKENEERRLCKSFLSFFIF